MKTQSLFIGVLLAAWGILTVSSFWVFEGRYLRPAARPAGASVARVFASSPGVTSLVQTDHGEITLAESGKITVLNFWNPDCPCSRFAEPEVSRLAAQYGPQGVRFVTIVASGSSADGQRQALVCWHAQHVMEQYPAFADTGNHFALTLGVWAAPAAVILDPQGKTVFVGTYNAGRFCCTAGTAWAAQALAAVIRGQRPTRPTTPFYGCQLLAAKS